MNLDDAIAAHAEWKIKLRGAIEKHEVLDAKTISADNCCALGHWLHGEARARLSASQVYRELLTKHASFHAEAGHVATAINAKQFEKASGLLEAGTAYSTASTAVAVAIGRLKRECVDQAA